MERIQGFLENVSKVHGANAKLLMSATSSEREADKGSRARAKRKEKAVQIGN